MEAGEALIQRNCVAMMRLVHHYAQQMVSAGCGGIVIFSSGAALAGGPNMVHELAEFGLIEVTDPMPNRQRGRIQLGETGGKPPEPYNISVPMFSGQPSMDALFDLSMFETPAVDRVISNLAFQAPRFR